MYRTDVESLTDAEVEGVRALGSELQAMCRELAASSEHTEALAEMPDARARIRTAYLAPWRRWAIAERWSAGRLERAFAPLFLRALLRIVAEETPLPGSA